MTMDDFQTHARWRDNAPTAERRWLALRWPARLLIVAMAAQLAACGSSPVVRFHTLLPADSPAPRALPAGDSDTTGNTTGNATGNTTALVVSLSTITVPTQVDQPQWLVRLPDDTLALLEQDRWAGPLRDELRSALLEVLVARWGAVDARTAAQGQTAGQAAVWQITLDVSRFESTPGREARLDSRWSATTGQPGAPSAACGSTLRESAADGLAALAQAHRRAVARLGDEIGQQLQALQRGEAARCPGTAASAVN
jgi:uncharacterized lipoprotein YmbA